MRLSTKEGPDRQVETRAELERALATWGDAEDAFVVLERGEGEFVQAAGSRREGYVVEYRERGDVVPSKRHDLAKADVLSVLGDHLEGKPWKTRLEWEPEEAFTPVRSRGSGKKGQPIGFGAGLLLLGLFVLVLAAIQGVDAEALRAHGATARGTVLSATVHRGRKGRSSTHAVIEFEAGARRIRLEDATVPRGTRPGAIVVYYDPVDPRRASVVPPGETVASSRAFVAIGVVLGLLGAGILAWGLRERRRAKAVAAGQQPVARRS